MKDKYIFHNQKLFLAKYIVLLILGKLNIDYSIQIIQFILRFIDIKQSFNWYVIILYKTQIQLLFLLKL